MKQTNYSDQTPTFASHTQKKKNKFVRPTRPPQQQWPPSRTKNGDLSILFFSRIGLRTYQHPCTACTQTQTYARKQLMSDEILISFLVYSYDLATFFRICWYKCRVYKLTAVNRTSYIERSNINPYARNFMFDWHSYAQVTWHEAQGSKGAILSATSVIMYNNN